ncbi:MAG TPA: hypothetical protein VGL40_08380 [Bacillota bacterium]|jgi:hypothetical protein
MTASAATSFPKVAYDELTDVLYIALARVRNCYARPDGRIPNMLHCFNEIDDEPCGVLIRGYSTLDPAVLLGRLGMDLDLPSRTSSRAAANG